jgi:hypothetical protein
MIVTGRWLYKEKQPGKRSIKFKFEGNEEDIKLFIVYVWKNTPYTLV